jgi:hypothetical protein
MFIANLAFERKDAPPQHRWKKFGRLWCKAGRASIFLSGVRQGRWVARVWENVVDPPLIIGDICYWTGYIHDDMRKEYQWIGRINSSQEHDENTMYSGSIEIIPMISTEEGKFGLWASIFMDDAYKHKGQEDLPF